MKRISLTIEMDIQDESLASAGITAEQLLESACGQNDTLSGPAFVNALLGNVRLVKKEILYGPYKDDGMQGIRDAVREDIRLNGESCYELSPEEVRQLTEELDPTTEEIVQAVYARMMKGQDPDRVLDEEVGRKFA